MTKSETVATVHERDVSIDRNDGDCSMDIALLARPAGHSERPV
jgi:hypothetical protein